MMRAIAFGLAVAGTLAVSLVHAAGDPARGKEISATCAACHGVTGMSPLDQFPHLAGQHAEYLERALLDYQVGNRKNAIMAQQVEKLEKQDIRDLAAYFAAQKGLYVRR